MLGSVIKRKVAHALLIHIMLAFVPLILHNLPCVQIFGMAINTKEKERKNREVGGLENGFYRNTAGSDCYKTRGD